MKIKQAWQAFWKAQHRKAYTHSAEAIREKKFVLECEAEQKIRPQIQKLVDKINSGEWEVRSLSVEKYEVNNQIFIIRLLSFHLGNRFSVGWINDEEVAVVDCQWDEYEILDRALREKSRHKFDVLDKIEEME